MMELDTYYYLTLINMVSFMMGLDILTGITYTAYHSFAGIKVVSYNY